MTDENPTESFDQVAPGAPQPTADEQSRRKRKRLFMILAAIGGALLILIVILLLALLAKGSTSVEATPSVSPSQTVSASPSPSASTSASPSATPTPSPTPTPSAAPTTPPPPPPSTSANITKFTAGSTTILCNSDAEFDVTYPLSFTWTTKNATQIAFGVQTNDAILGPLFDNLPPNGNSNSDFPYPVEFNCPQTSQTYTLTVVGADGVKDSKTITVVNNGDTM